MNLKLIIALVSDDDTDDVIAKARKMGATGATVITSGRGEGLTPQKSFLGLTIDGQTDMLLFIVEQHLSRQILEALSGSGVAMQINIEDAIGLTSQLETIEQKIEDQI